ncbi:transposase DDE domain protein [Orientia tsutsugamushi str. Gilliam]|uniref:(P)ppGpp synthetase n=1 Tax=Orientia tsutsugamushi str. Gilliam TaxID=1359184 RepID=A0A0F3M7I8_ORITS|nr:transposase DDE domain protein [Orientia tsutsugamushi str. Gilliam]SPR05058.1 (p)ppGpp synthetase [Orientia tsutsugamushi str. Gilliam]
MLLSLVVLMHYLKGEETGIYYIDSTKLTICHNKRTSSNRVFNKISKIDKSSYGWLLVFKLHLIINNIAEQVSDFTSVRNNKKISAMEMIQTFYRQNKTELLLIKLFERFHNIQTVSIKPYEKRQEIILETQQEFIPLAEYLKLPKIAIELNKYCELYAT